MFSLAQSRQSPGITAMTADAAQRDPVSLDTLPSGQCARIVRIDGGRAMIQRLMSLGVTKGCEVEILHHRGKGVVLGLNGNRVALGAGVANQILALPLDACTDHG